MTTKHIGTVARRGLLTGALAVAVWALAQPVAAQFNSGSNGSDGAITINLPPGQTSYTFEFDPRTICTKAGVTCDKSAGTGGAVQLDEDGDNVYHFTSVAVGTNVQVRLWADLMRHPGPVVWLATGNVTFGRGAQLQLSGEAGHLGGTNAAVRAPSRPGPGAFPGGVGAKQGDIPSTGAGPGGGARSTNGQFGCPGGHVIDRNVTNCAGGGNKYGTASIQPLIGGSGGSGGHASGVNGGGGGAAGGGAIRISASGTITLPWDGWVAADGGASYARGSGGYDGGAGSGGSLHFQASRVTCANTGLYVRGGRSGGDIYGSPGRIRIDSPDYANTCGASEPPLLSEAVPSVPLPTAIPTVRVVSLGGQAVPPQPANQYTVPDVSVDSTAALPVSIEARNIPRGTVVRLIVSSESGGADQTVETTPLQGDSDDITTATASVVLPRGVSRVYVRAVW